MKFSKLFSVLAMVLAFVVLSACAPVAGAQGFVELPDPVKADITAIVIVAVSWLFAKLVSMWQPLAFLEQFRLPLAMALASQLIGYIQVAIPDAFGAIAILVIQLVLAVIALFLTANTLKAKGYRLF